MKILLSPPVKSLPTAVAGLARERERYINHPSLPLKYIIQSMEIKLPKMSKYFATILLFLTALAGGAFAAPSEFTEDSEEEGAVRAHIGFILISQRSSYTKC